MTGINVMDLLGRIVDLDDSSPMSRSVVATELAVEAPQLPKAVERSLNVLIASPGWDAVDDVRGAVAESRMWEIGGERFVTLVANLACRGLLAEGRSATILAECAHPTRHELTEDSRQLVEVADAVTEDAREGYMDIDDDSTFQKALFALARLPDPTTKP